MRRQKLTNYEQAKETALTNHKIKSKEVRLIVENDSQIISTARAIQQAEQQGLDLVCISPTATPPVCKIMDVGKYLYEQKKKQKALDKKNRESVVDLKEINLSCKYLSSPIPSTSKTVAPKSFTSNLNWFVTRVTAFFREKK